MSPYTHLLFLIDPVGRAVIRPIGASTGVKTIVGCDLAVIEHDAHFGRCESENAVSTQSSIRLEDQADSRIGAIGKSEDGAIVDLLRGRLIAVDRLRQ